MIISGEEQGKNAALKAIDILMGEKVKDIPVMKISPNRYMFDYNYLKKFDINLNNLPIGSIIINKPISYLEEIWKYRLAITIVFTTIVFLIGVIVVLAFNIKRRKKIESQLSKTNKSYDRFVPHEFLDNLKKDSILNVELGDYIEREMTIMFSDIRSFTQLSESMSPEDNFKFLNSYLKMVGPIIRNNNGFIDKYIGDAVMAIYPNCVDDAVKACIAMQLYLVDYNLIRKRLGRIEIAIGIGLHYGDIMMGTIGETMRMEGTVISDTVNLASRLEGLTKVFGAQILVSESVFNKIGDAKTKYNYRYLGAVQVKGKTDGVSIYEIIDGNINSVVESKLKTKKMFENGVQLYKSGKLDISLEQFTKIKEIGEDKAVEFYIDLIKSQNRNKNDDWNGVITFDHK